MWIAYACFTIEVFSLYIKKVGTLLGTSGFFLVTGLMVAAFAYAAWRLNDSKAEAEGRVMIELLETSTGCYALSASC